MRSLGVILVLSLLPVTAPARDLNIYFVDVEGGQATLLVSPSGESLLVDTGWPGFSGRDADRIVAAARIANLRRIDYVLVTHYHMDHVGGVTQLAERIPIGTFIDHGHNTESGKESNELFAAFEIAAQKAPHRVVKPGDSFTLGEVNVQVLTAAGEHIAAPFLRGTGQPNRFCADLRREADDLSENAQSVGILVTLGKFSFIDLGDLTWNKELDMMCPNNPIGTVDLYLTSHHGLSISGSKALVWALHPRVAVMNNGARKGGEPEAWQVVESSPGLEDFWQLHYALGAGKEHNVTDSYVANLEEKCAGNYLQVSAQPDGAFTMTNSRNGFSKTYPPVR